MRSEKELHHCHGFTLVDVMMTVLILTIALVGMMVAFPNISKSILVSKTRSLATTAAQEKLEEFKNMAYYKIRVTTATVLDTRYTPSLEYDIGYYPKETFSTGGISYERAVYVEKVQGSTGTFTHVDWALPDVGMKRVTVYVIYNFEGAAGDTKKLTMSTLVENPDRQQLNASLSGVTQSTSGAAIPSASIYASENPAFQTTSNAAGSYSFNVPAGTWTLVTSATGYFLNTSSSVFASSGTVTTKNLALYQRFLANVTGYAFIQDHLMVTQVVSSTDVAGSGEQEWVELYNPTTYQILIASRSSPASDFNIFYTTVSWIDNNDSEPGPGNNGKYLIGMPGGTSSVFSAFRSTSPYWTQNTSTISVPPSHYFLVANKSTITFTTPSGNVQKIADAYYSGTRIDNSSAGGIRITGALGKSFNGRSDWHDGVAWKSNSSDNSPTLVREGSAGYDLNSESGIDQGRVLVRSVFKSSTTSDATSLTISKKNSSPFAANCFDRNENGVKYNSGSDWIEMSAASYFTTSSGVVNSDFAMHPYSGTPAAGAIVTSNDGLSGAAFVQSHGSFTLTNVTTGAWVVALVSATPTTTFYQEIYATVTVASPQGIPHSLSTPQWNLSVNFSSLSLTTSNGIIAGRVTGANGSGIGNITLDALAQTAQTNSQGYYRLNIASGSYTVGCNLVNVNVSYTQGSSVPVVVELGQVKDNVDFTLISGGNLRGFVTSNGVDALPGYTLSLQRDGVEYKSAVSETDGYFLMTNVSTVSTSNPYSLDCITELGEATSPDLIVSTPTAGTTVFVGTFTVTAGFGTFTGTLTVGGNKIDTGVILVASTQPIVTTSSGPAIDSTLTSGTTIYYFAASGSDGIYNMKVLGGPAYYLYGWYNSPTAGLVRKSSAPTTTVGIGESKTVNLQW